MKPKEKQKQKLKINNENENIKLLETILLIFVQIYVQHFSEQPF